MGRSWFTERGVRRYALRTGLPLQAITARGGSGHWAVFRTVDDRHGMLHLVPPYEVDWREPWGHWSDCPPPTARHR